MRNIIAWAIKNNPAMNILTMGLLLVGFASLYRMQREVFPEFELEIILVSVPYPGASPAEVEDGIVQKIEEACRGIDGIKKQTAIAREGSGFLVLECRERTDVQKILDDVRAAIDRIPSFPELAEDPEIQQIIFREPAIRVGVVEAFDRTPDMDPLDLELRLRAVSEQIRDEILQLPSVSQAIVVGSREYQIDVVSSSDRNINPFGFFRRLGFRAQLVTLLVFVLGTTLVAYSVVLYRNFQKVHETEFDTALYNYSVDIAKSLKLNLYGEVFLSDDIKQADEKIFPFALERTQIQLRTMRGFVVARSRDLGEAELPLNDQEREEVLRARASFTTRTLQIRGTKETRYRIANVFIDQPGPRDFILQVASPMLLLERERRGLVAFFLLSIPATLGIAAVLSYTLSSQATKPIGSIIKKAKAITAQRIDQRLPVPKVKDEIHELAITLNGMMDRLQRAFVSQEAFVSDASHQLKTPLAIMRGELDMAMRENRTPEQTREFMESASQEIGYMTRMVEQLLIIARLESNHQGGIEFHPTRLDEVAIDVISRMEKHASIAAKKIKLTFRFEGDEEADYSISADFDLIRTLMESLIDNALKYTRENTTVAVEVRDRADSIEFRVTDQGEGMTEEEREKLFARFWRSPKFDNSAVKGSGLGLSIVRKIADLHLAKVDVDTTLGVGSQFSVLFPKART